MSSKLRKQALHSVAAAVAALLMPIVLGLTLPAEDRLSLIVFSWYWMIPLLLVSQAIRRVPPVPATILLVSFVATVAEYMRLRSVITQSIIESADIFFNPQTLLYVISAVALIVGAVSLWRKGFQLSLVFWMVGALMSVSATTMFHQLIIQWPQDVEIKNTKETLQRIGAYPDFARETSCRALEWECYPTTPGEVPALMKMLDIQNAGIVSIAGATTTFDRVSHAWKVSSILASDITSNSYVAGYYKSGSRALVVFDFKRHEQRKGNANDRFAYLAIAFHAFWIVMISGLSVRHRYIGQAVPMRDDEDEDEA